MAYFLNQGDRQIFNAVLPLIKADLGLSDVQLGLVVSGFTFIYGALVPVAGYLGDRCSRKWIICLSLLVFSTGTLLTGFAGGMIGLFVFRSIATGGGEAFYYPPATSLIGEHHHATRAQAMAVHQTAVYVGIVASSVIAAAIGERYGWRASFYAFGGFGVLMAGVLMARLRDDRPASSGEKAPTPGEALRVVLRIPTFHFLSAAFGAMVFVNVGFTTWMPTFLYERFHLSLKEAAFHAVFLHLVFAFFGVMLGGRVSDRLAPRRPGVRLETGWIGLALGAPFIWLLGASPTLAVVYAGLAGFGFFRGIYDSNLFAALFDVVPPRYRSSATGLMLAFAFIVGATAPALLGYLKPRIGLSTGLSALAFAYVLGGALIFAAGRLTFARDHRAARL
jgi:MFS family permease